MQVNSLANVGSEPELYTSIYIDNPALDKHISYKVRNHIGVLAPS